MPARISGPPKLYSLNTGWLRRSAGTCASSERGFATLSGGVSGHIARASSSGIAAASTGRLLPRGSVFFPSSGGMITAATIANQLWWRSCMKASISIVSSNNSRPIGIRTPRHSRMPSTSSSAP